VELQRQRSNFAAVAAEADEKTIELEKKVRYVHRYFRRIK
jgi:hypothetical protein